MKLKDSESSMKKMIHLDLLGEREESMHNLMALSNNLEGEIINRNVKDRLTLTNKNEFNAKYAEMMGEKLSYAIMASAISDEDSFFVANELVRRLDSNRFENNGDRKFIAFPERDNIAYNKQGEIIFSNNRNLIGKNCLEYIACNIHEDFGVVLAKGDKLIYSFDSAMFEKTPKDPITGKNLFIGKDLLDFHEKAKNFGHILPTIFQKMIDAFSEKHLEMLSIDLRGANTYSDGNIGVRRFERDYVVPIMQPNFKGIIVYTDVFFQDVNETNSPFENGSYIDVSNPIKFANNFKVK